jgi:putative YhdH/YhfP family quinone oxidoreductase
MAYGTAGFTAAMSVFRLENQGVTSGQGDVLVTGATGGVGSLVVAILAQEGYRVVAATGKLHQAPYLRDLGAAEVVHRDEVLDTTGRPLLKGRWAGAVDTVGGEFLATALKSTRYRGTVTTCGNVASAELHLTVYPFILRGVSLLGIDSANCPMPMRLELWQKLAHAWRLPQLEQIVSVCALSGLDRQIDRILEGEQRGRIVVNVGG